MRPSRIFQACSALAALLATVLTLAAPAAAATRSAPVGGGFTACSQIGVHDNDLSTAASFHFGTHAYLALAGDVSGWADGKNTRSVSKLFVVSMPDCKLVWAGPKIGPSNGWIRSMATRTSGNQAMIYFGGAFTSVNGQRRNHSAAIGASYSHGRVAFRLSRWTVNSRADVNHLAVDGHRVYVGSGNLMAVSLYAARRLWSQPTSACGITALTVSGTMLFAGGFEHRVSGGWQFLLRKFSAATGKTYGGFTSPRFRPNQKYCADPSATGHQTYSGTIPISLTIAAGLRIGLIGGGGMSNRLMAFSTATGKVRWTKGIYGDGQVVALVDKHTFFGGWHLSGTGTAQKAKHFGSVGNYFDIRTGAVLTWNKRTALVTSGANRDGSNNGSKFFVAVAGLNCLGGGFNGERHGFACQRRA